MSTLPLVHLRDLRPAEGSSLVGTAGLVCAVAAAVASSWGGVQLLGTQVSDLALVAALVLLAFEAATRRITVYLPKALLQFGVVVVAIACVQVLLPAAQDFLTQRFVLVTFLSTGDAANVTPYVKAAQWLVSIVVIPVIVVVAGSVRSGGLALIAAGYVAGACVSAAIAVLDWMKVTSVSSELLGYINITGRQAGLTLHPNNLAVSALMALPLAVHLCRRNSTVQFLLVGLLLTGILLSGSRAAQVVAALVVLSLAVRFEFFRRAALLAIIAGGAAAAALVVGDSSNLLRFGGNSVDSSDAGRAELAAQALRDFEYNPIYGIGLQYIARAHSIYLQVISAGGLVLLISFGLYMGGVLTQARVKDPLVGILPFVSAVAVVAWLLVGAVENQITDRFLYYPVALIVAQYSILKLQSKGVT